LTEIRAFATESFSLGGSMLLYSKATMYQVQFYLAAFLFVAGMSDLRRICGILRAVDNHETRLRD
jgi:hypothetical protein